MNNVDRSDFPNMCRLCLGQGRLRNICEMPRYLFIIHNNTNVKIQESDTLPKNICNVCVLKLEGILQFIDLCNRSNDALSVLQDIKISAHNCVETTESQDVSEHDFSDDASVKCEDNADNSYPETENDVVVPNLVLTCIMCNWIGEDRKSLREHEKEHRSEANGWKCVDCEKLFQKKIDFQRHRRIHTGIRPYLCIKCGKGFTQKGAMDRHIRSRHEKKQIRDRLFACYICENKFFRKDNLNAHMKKVHIKKQHNIPFEIENSYSATCKKCQKSFSMFSYLQDHQSIHEENIPKKAKSNSNRFSSPSTNLCSICGQSFETRKSFHTHMAKKHLDFSYKRRPHRQKGSFQCYYCGKILTTQGNLKVHIRIHTGERPYTCQYCGQKFVAQTSWEEHENIHTGVKPFQCEYCKKSFRQRASLRKHLRSSLHKKEGEFLNVQPNEQNGVSM